ncbi:transposase [Streptomyces lasalocidi]
MLVDVEAGRVVDVLPDRTSETFAAWLKDHPGAEIICRDRATAYTKAVREAAPNALEVADRWHLLPEPGRRGGEDLPSAPRLPAQTRRGGHGDRSARAAPDAVTARGTDPHPDDRTHPPPLRRHPPPAGETLDDQRHRPSAEPRPQDPAPLPRHRPRRADLLCPQPPPQRRAGAVQGIPECTPHRDTRPGQRHQALPGGPGPRLPGQPPGRPQTSRRPAGGHRRTGPGRHPQPPQDHLVDHAASRDAQRDPGRTAASSPARCPDITRACNLAHAFADLVRHQRGYLLLEWIRQAEQDAPKPVKGFAGFLRQDLDAVTAGLTLS